MRRSLHSVMILALVLTGFAFAGCQQSASLENESASKQHSAARKPATPFETDLDYVRKGQFHHIYVFSRQDGGKFQPDDIAYLKANSPKQTNMWVSTDEGRRAIAGSNFDFEPAHMDALSKRFIIEDYTGK